MGLVYRLIDDSFMISIISRTRRHENVTNGRHLRNVGRIYDKII